MEKKKSKITWIHITYDANGKIALTITTDRWRDKTYMGRRRSNFTIEREKKLNMYRLIRVLSRTPFITHTIYSWNGYSICYERKDY